MILTRSETWTFLHISHNKLVTYSVFYLEKVTCEKIFSLVPHNGKTPHYICR